MKQRFDKIGRKGTLVIIWGAGNHSEGGVRKIKPAVIDILNSEKVKFDDDTPNHGCCTVYFSGKEAVPTAPAAKTTPAVPAASPTPKPSSGKTTTLPVTKPAEPVEETKCCSCCCVM